MDLKKNLPKKIRLLGEDYRLKVGNWEEFSCSDCGDEEKGKIDWYNKIIYAADNSKYEIDDIILHELGHYFGDYYSISESECFAEAFAKFTKLIMEQIYE